MDTRKYIVTRLLQISIALLIGIGSFTASCSSNGYLQSSATPLSTTVPTDTVQALPDLAILDTSLEIDSDDVCAPLKPAYPIRVVIKNQGTAATEQFEVRVNQTSQSITTHLPPGGTVVMHYMVSNLQLDIWVDEKNQVEELVENNNHLVRQIVPPSPIAVCLRTPSPIVAIQSPANTLEGHTAQVLSVAFSPDGSLIASGSVDNTLRLWQVDNPSLLRTMRGHPFPVLNLAFSPNGAYLATGSTEGSIRLWQVSDGRLLRTLEGHGGWVTGLVFSPTGTALFSGSDDFTVRQWRTFDGRLVETIDEGMDKITSLAISPNSLSLAWSEVNGTVRLRSLEGAWLHTMNVDACAATSVAFTQNGEWLAAGFSDGTIRIWQVEDGILIQVLSSHTGAVTSIAFSPNNMWLVSGSKDSTLRLWRVVDANIQSKPQLVFFGHSGPVNSVAFSPLGTLVGSASDDNTVRLWAIPEN